MDLTAILQTYGAGGVSLALLCMFFWFVKDIALSMKEIPKAIAATSNIHKEEIRVVVQEHREVVHAIIKQHADELGERDKRHDAFVLEFVRTRGETRA